MKPTQVVQPSTQQQRHNLGTENILSQNSGGGEPEPIYQNQAELMQQILASTSKVGTNDNDIKEPIYQNLPAHERLLLEEQKQKPQEEQKMQSAGVCERLPAGAITPEEQSQTDDDVPTKNNISQKNTHLQATLSQKRQSGNSEINNTRISTNKTETKRIS